VSTFTTAQSYFLNRSFAIVAEITLHIESDLCLVKEGSACISNSSSSGGGGGGGGNHVARAGDVINEVAFVLTPSSSSPAPSLSPLSTAASLSLSSSSPSSHKTISSGASGCLIYVIQRQHFSENEFAAASW
jgi:hypothetical protein